MAQQAIPSRVPSVERHGPRVPRHPAGEPAKTAVSVSGSVAATDTTATSFLLEVTNTAAGNVVIRIRGGGSASIVLEWQGDIARRLLYTRFGAHARLSPGIHTLDKCAVKQLTLAAAGLKMAASGNSADQPAALANRLGQLELQLPAAHNRVASLLFQHRGVHFEQHEAVSLVLLTFPVLCPAKVTLALGQLVDWRVLQRITIDDCVFFDVDTSPHLHVFCERTRQLFDAPPAGVVRSF